MDKKLLKNAAIQSLALMLAVIVLSFAMDRYRAVVISAGSNSGENIARAEELEQAEDLPDNEQNTNDNSKTENDNAPVEDTINSGFPGLFKDTDKDITDKLGERFIIIKKPAGNIYSITLEDIYISKSIRLTLSGGGILNSSFIGRYYNSSFFAGEPEYTEYPTYETKEDETVETVLVRDYGQDIVHGITITSSPVNEEDEYETEILLELNNVYVHTIIEDEAYYYILLQEPAKVYERILVIDAGHGGKDAGAISKEGHYEKEINLQIVYFLKELLDQEDIKVYYTRLSDDTVYLRPRVQLANSVQCDMFISIHCNSNNVSGPKGTEILYYDTSIGGIDNRRLAKIMSDEISKAIPLKNRGLISKEKEDIYILNKAEVPAALIETGYLSNSHDLDYLLIEENQKAVAQGIYNGIMKAYEEVND